MTNSIASAPVYALSERSRAIRAFATNRALTLFVTDLAMLSLASLIAIYVISQFNHDLVYWRVVQSAVIWTATSLWMFKALGLYRISYALDCRDEWYYVIAGLAIGVAPLLVVFTAIPLLSSSRMVLLVSFLLSVLLVGAARSVIHYRFDRDNGRSKRRVALVGPDGDLSRIANLMERRSSILELVPADDTQAAMVGAVRGEATWYNVLRAQGCKEILFVGLPTPYTALMVERAARDGIAIGFAPPGLASQAYRLDVLRSQRQPLFVAGRVAACTPLNQLLKRLFDVTVASFALILTGPIMLAVMLAIVCESGRPAIFRQTRIGKDGKPFEILKLRSMVCDAEAISGPVWAVGDPTQDRRTTKVGAFIRKTSIDELPQFINVLKGEMSIVGPRPERPIFVENFRKDYVRYDERHLVRPGITGWAHVHMRRSPGMEQIGERLDLDLFYIENYSLSLDLFVTFKTAVEVLFQRW
ncbi:MAG: sugar transferase [Candidatus Eremiobacteraeota bacterium]|nr:sugar transferase [Candidatus Eremiobacteraeota bacterium]